MRSTFIKTLTELARQDERIVLLTADLGYTVLEPFRDSHPDRFFNVGVAEQNAVGLATGLAEDGFIPFVYSIATFATLRPYEFLRDGPLLHHLPVRIVGVGGGYEYGLAGPTHHALEDVAVMRCQPGMAVYTPADFQQADTILRKNVAERGPAYYRLSKNDKGPLPGLAGAGGEHVHVLRVGAHKVVAMGAAAITAVQVVDILAGRNYDVGLITVSCVGPSPTAELTTALAGATGITTVEAHYACGGLGSLVAEVMAEAGLGVKLDRAAVTEAPDGRSGKEAWLMERANLSIAALTARISAVAPRGNPS